VGSELIRLACAQPGETVATFGDALRRVSEQGQYVHQDVFMVESVPYAPLVVIVARTARSPVLFSSKLADKIPDHSMG
jgi:hypothetical protein